MRKTSVLILSLLVLAGCERREEYSERRVAMEVINVTLSSKTNSTVDLRELASGQVHRRLRLSCNRDKAKRVRIGSLWDVSEVTYLYPESRRFTTQILGTPAICDKSQ
jgi:uncharacterized protein YcfL